MVSKSEQHQHQITQAPPSPPEKWTHQLWESHEAEILVWAHIEKSWFAVLVEVTGEASWGLAEVSYRIREHRGFLCFFFLSLNFSSNQRSEWSIHSDGETVHDINNTLTPIHILQLSLIMCSNNTSLKVVGLTERDRHKMWLASCNYSNPCSMSSKSINPSVEAARNESAFGLYVSPLMVLPKSKPEAISLSCFGYKNKTTWKSISFWQVDIVHKLILFKLTPNNFLFKSKTKYTVMFGILITSVFTWHFVYVTVLFFLLFSSMAAITGGMIHGLLREADDRAARLWDEGEKKK